MRQILIGINNKIYDVTKYIPNHPGEGIVGSYLKNFDRRDCTKEFNRLHLTNEPEELLELAVNNKNKLIFYVSPYFNFSKRNRIPKYYYFIKEKKEIEENLIENKYIVFYFENKLQLSYKINNEIKSYIINLIDNNYTVIINSTIYKNVLLDDLIKEIIEINIT